MKRISLSSDKITFESFEQFVLNYSTFKNSKFYNKNIANILEKLEIDIDFNNFNLIIENVIAIFLLWKCNENTTSKNIKGVGTLWKRYLKKLSSHFNKTEDEIKLILWNHFGKHCWVNDYLQNRRK